MVQFKNGAFQQLNSETVLPEVGDNWDVMIAAADFEDFDSYGSADCLQIHIYRRKHANFGQDDWLKNQHEWLIDIWNHNGAYPQIYCATDADFAPLMLQLSGMIAACFTAQMSVEIEMACSDLQGPHKPHYSFADLLVALSKDSR